MLRGGDEQELKGDGLYEDHRTRYQTASEYVKIWREILTRSIQVNRLLFHGERPVSMMPNYFILLCKTLSTPLVWWIIRRRD